MLSCKCYNEINLNRLYLNASKWYLNQMKIEEKINYKSIFEQYIRLKYLNADLIMCKFDYENFKNIYDEIRDKYNNLQLYINFVV
jgi:hypothetical protein